MSRYVALPDPGYATFWIVFDTVELRIYRPDGATCNHHIGRRHARRWAKALNEAERERRSEAWRRSFRHAA